MSEKSLDAKGRWRSVTVGFRMSPEEVELLNTKVYLSGLTKQDYITVCILQNGIFLKENQMIISTIKRATRFKI